MMRSALVSRHNPENLLNLKYDAFPKPGLHSDLKLKIPLRNCMDKLKTQNTINPYQVSKSPENFQKSQKNFFTVKGDFILESAIRFSNLQTSKKKNIRKTYPELEI